MENTVCTPKSRSFSGTTVTLPTHIAGNAALKAPIAAFCDYAKELGLEFTAGEGGIALWEDPQLVEEACDITITEDGITVSAATVKGFHNALAILLGEIRGSGTAFSVETGHIAEAPDMPYRGLMVDLARQKHGYAYILRYIDLCYRNRATHLQLHFADDESFTLPMRAFADLSTEGKTYTKEELAIVRAYAQSRGIVLVPEIDVPGHTSQFCLKYPALFGTQNVLPADNEVFEALRQIFTELLELFPDSPLIHIGGDEAAIARWENCEKTQAYMRENGIANIHEMYAEYIRIVTDMILEMGRTPVVWEGFAKEYNDRISKDVIVICWESYYQPAYDVAAAGFTVINCSWKPLYIVTPDTHWTPEEILGWNPWNWQHFWEKSVAYPDGYSIDPATSHVLGGQICAWGDRLAHYEDWEKGAKEELELIAQRLPALCKRLIDLDA